MNRIIRDEDTPKAFALTWLIAIWKKKGSTLDLNQMRYIHTKLWDAKLCEALGDAQLFQRGTPSHPKDMDENARGIKQNGYNQHL